MTDILRSAGVDMQDPAVAELVEWFDWQSSSEAQNYPSFTTDAATAQFNDVIAFCMDSTPAGSSLRKSLSEAAFTFAETHGVAAEDIIDARSALYFGNWE